MSERDKLIEAMARAMYESIELKRRWEHPDTVRIWHPMELKQARAALDAIEVAGWRLVPPEDGR